jgi:hypothetical protein
MPHTKKLRRAKSAPAKFMPETVALNKLLPHPRNYRVHTEDQLAHLIESIKKNGFYRNVVVAKNNTILAGHGVVEAARKIKLTEIPVIRLNLDPSDPRALKVLAGDNEISRLAEIDDRALTDMLKDIKLMDTSLLGTGFDDMMLASLVMVTRPEDEIQTFDAASHWVGMPAYDKSGKVVCAVVNFRNEEDRLEFLKVIGITNPRKYQLKNTVSMWWPAKTRDDLKSLRFDTKKANEDQA